MENQELTAGPALGKGTIARSVTDKVTKFGESSVAVCKRKE